MKIREFPPFQGRNRGKVRDCSIDTGSDLPPQEMRKLNVALTYIVVAVSWVIAVSPALTVAFADEIPRTKYSPLERMTPGRLKAAHEDVGRIQASREGSFLARPERLSRDPARHAEDSAHTGGTRPEMLADAKKAGVNAILL